MLISFVFGKRSVMNILFDYYIVLVQMSEAVTVTVLKE